MRVLDGMRTWLRRINIALTIGGGAIGVLSALFALLRLWNQPKLVLVAVAMVFFFAFGIHIGVNLLRAANVRSQLLWFYGPQIPVLSSPAVTFFLCSGARMNVGVFGGSSTQIGTWAATLACFGVPSPR
jgi:hypothetical protein